MFSYLTFAVCTFAASLTPVKGDCLKDCKLSTVLYQDLRCIPKYGNPDDCCPTEFDCSHIYNRPAGTCHFKGKFYKLGETPDQEDTAGGCDHAHCECSEKQDFNCIVPSDSCAEFWVPGFVRPGCYLKYELNRCCSSGQTCPPFENLATCEVNGVTYKEGQRFDHPEQKCNRCVCNKGFNGDFGPEFCQMRNCTTELRYSKEIDNYCAPLYRDFDSCCPDSWICPSENGNYVPAKTRPNPDPKCKFGEKTMLVGEKYQQIFQHRNITCECDIPPYLTCFKS